MAYICLPRARCSICCVTVSLSAAHGYAVRRCCQDADLVLLLAGSGMHFQQQIGHRPIKRLARTEANNSGPNDCAMHHFQLQARQRNGRRQASLCPGRRWSHTDSKRTQVIGAKLINRHIHAQRLSRFGHNTRMAKRCGIGIGTHQHHHGQGRNPWFSSQP